MVTLMRDWWMEADGLRQGSGDPPLALSVEPATGGPVGEPAGPCRDRESAWHSSGERTTRSTLHSTSIKFKIPDQPGNPTG
jgi:hypothetical protein